MRETLLSGIELVNGDCAEILPKVPAADLILTSPPYDEMRRLGGYNDAFDFQLIARAIAANLAPGGVLVWVVGDQIIDGGESCSRFRQALAFLDLGLTLHQTLIYYRWSLAAMSPTAYFRTHSDMYVFAKGKPKTANLLHDKPNSRANQRFIKRGAGRNGDSSVETGRGAYGTIPAAGAAARGGPDGTGGVWDYPCAFPPRQRLAV